jgi:hypothetical protein
MLPPGYTSVTHWSSSGCLNWAQQPESLLEGLAALHEALAGPSPQQQPPWQVLQIIGPFVGVPDLPGLIWLSLL